MAIGGAIAALTTTQVAVGALAIGTVGSLVNQSKAQSSQRKASRADRAIARANTARQRRQEIRKSRIERAEITNVAAQTGAEGSSSAVGALGSVQTQLSSNLSFLDTTQRLSDESRKFSQRAANQLATANLFQTAGEFGAKAATSGVFGGDKKK